MANSGESATKMRISAITILRYLSRRYLSHNLDSSQSHAGKFVFQKSQPPSD